jgi:hypothetical protein
MFIFHSHILSVSMYLPRHLSLGRDAPFSVLAVEKFWALVANFGAHTTNPTACLAIAVKCQKVKQLLSPGVAMLLTTLCDSVGN